MLWMAWAAALAAARKRREDNRREHIVRLSNHDDRITRHFEQENGPPKRRRWLDVTIRSRDHQRGPLPASVPRPLKLTRDRLDAAAVPAHVRVIGGAIDDQDRDYIARKLGMRLSKFAASVERITVRLSDTNGPKGGLDQKCQVKVVLSGMPSVVVHQTDSTLTRTIDRAIDSAALAVRRRIQRRRLKPLHHRTSPAPA